MLLNQGGRVTWSNQIANNPSLKNLENWKGMKSTMIQYSKDKIFLRNTNIVASVTSGMTLTETAYKYNVNISKVHYLLDRTLATKNVEEEPNLTKGLIPNLFINKKG